jgi:hypothetical protein
MQVAQALECAHVAQRKGMRASCDWDCEHCALIALADHVKRQEQTIKELRARLGIRQATKASCKCCGRETFDGICGVCDC